ncbi:MAG: DNA primase [Gemmatimonadaceae bacterium]
MIPDEVIEQVREAADIVGIIGEYVQLKRTGSDYRGPCPFHQGTRRNFSVVPAKRLYHCFVCGESGDVFKFLTKRLGMEWPEAVKLVGEKSGIEVVDTKTRRDGPDPREPFWELLATAAAYFQRMLWDEPIGAPAREYLGEREITRAVADDFGLGFAPREIGLMRSYMNSLGFDDARLVEGGLVISPEQDVEPRPRFRNRLMFPILDVLGRNVGFGGRLIGPGEPKYLNSADSPVFSKGKLLYALNRSRNAIRKADRALVVEGYFDAVRLIAAGVEEVVAPLGTALTETQAAMLRKYTRNVYLLYDSDPAGLKATFRTGDELLQQGIAVRVVTLPAGDDPDSFVKAKGASGLEAEIAASIDVFERKIQILERAGWFGELQKKRRAIDRLMPTIRATADEITRDLYLARASEVTGVDRNILQRESGQTHAAPARVSGPPPDPARPAIRERHPEQRRSRFNPGSSAEKELVRAMLQDRSKVAAIAERIGPDSFRDPVYRSMFAAMLVQGEDATLASLTEMFDAEAIGVTEELLSGPEREHVEQTINDSIMKLEVREVEERLTAIDRLLPLASDEERESLQLEKQRLVTQYGSTGKLVMKAFRRRQTGTQGNRYGE